MSILWDVAAAIAEMHVGDSFFVPCVDCAPIRRQIQKSGEQQGVRLKTLFVIEGEIQGLRTWREPM